VNSAFKEGGVTFGDTCVPLAGTNRKKSERRSELSNPWFGGRVTAEVTGADAVGEMPTEGRI
jgi:hypothetical protein